MALRYKCADFDPGRTNQLRLLPFSEYSDSKDLAVSPQDFGASVSSHISSMESADAEGNMHQFYELATQLGQSLTNVPPSFHEAAFESGILDFIIKNLHYENNEPHYLSMLPIICGLMGSQSPNSFRKLFQSGIFEVIQPCLHSDKYESFNYALLSIAYAVHDSRSTSIAFRPPLSAAFFSEAASRFPNLIETVLFSISEFIVSDLGSEESFELCKCGLDTLKFGLFDKAMHSISCHSIFSAVEAEFYQYSSRASQFLKDSDERFVFVVSLIHPVSDIATRIHDRSKEYEQSSLNLAHVWIQKVKERRNSLLDSICYEDIINIALRIESNSCISAMGILSMAVKTRSSWLIKDIIDNNLVDSLEIAIESSAFETKTAAVKLMSRLVGYSSDDQLWNSLDSGCKSMPSFFRAVCGICDFECPDGLKQSLKLLVRLIKYSYRVGRYDIFNESCLSDVVEKASEMCQCCSDPQLQFKLSFLVEQYNTIAKEAEIK